jgi:hypothetical protein
MIARSNRPAAAGEASWEHTASPPADSPAMATLCGSPPNAAMLSRTQRTFGLQEASIG